MVINEKLLQQHLQSGKFNSEVTKITGYNNENEIAVLATSLDKRFVMTKSFFAVNDTFNGNYESLANQISKEILESIDACENIVANTNMLSNWDFAKTVVKPAIRPRKDDEFVRIPYLDLDIVFYVDLCKKLGSHFYVRKEDVENWNISTKELLSAANINCSQYYSSSVALDCIRRIGYIPCESDMCGLYIISSQLQKNGAYVLTQVEFLERIANDLQSDLVIFPSSIHELLFVPMDIIVETGEWFDNLISEINQDVLFPFDQLSSHHYIYHRGSLNVSYNE